MHDVPSLRPQVAGRLQSSAEQAIKRPVKEAVREALAEPGRTEPERDATPAESRRVEVDPSDESGDSATDDTESGARSSLRNRLRSRRTLALALVALGAYLRRRRSATADD